MKLPESVKKSILDAYVESVVTQAGNPNSENFMPSLTDEFRQMRYDKEYPKKILNSNAVKYLNVSEQLANEWKNLSDGNNPKGTVDAIVWLHIHEGDHFGIPMESYMYALANLSESGHMLDEIKDDLHEYIKGYCSRHETGLRYRVISTIESILAQQQSDDVH